MKKTAFALILAVLVMLPVSAFAQLNIKSETTKLKPLATSRAGSVTLTYIGGWYSVSINSTNQFEDPKSFYLGETKESAIKTLDDLLEIAGDGSKIVKVENYYRIVRLYGNNLMGTKVVVFDFGSSAGTYQLSTMELRKFKKAIEK